MREVTRSELVLNQALPWPLYDKAGKLLMHAGFVLSMPHYVDTLLARGACVGNPGALSSEGAPLVSSARPQARRLRDPVFPRAESVGMGVRRIHKWVSEPPPREGLEEYVRGQARQLIEASFEDPDSVLAAGHLNRQPKDYRVNHQFLGAILVTLMAPQLEMLGQDMEAIVCAALTRDVGILHLDPELTHSTLSELPDSLKQRITGHAAASVAMLREHGIADEDWLGFIQNHHERLDGSGYPEGKSGPELDTGSMLLSLADSYAAMTLPNSRRSGEFAGNTIRELFLKRHLYGEQLVALLYKTVTKYPPGSLVSLANGEVAVIKVKPEGELPPQVLSVYDRHGMPRMEPMPRDTANPEHAVKGVVAPEECRSAELIIKRLWLNA